MQSKLVSLFRAGFFAGLMAVTVTVTGTVAQAASAEKMKRETGEAVSAATDYAIDSKEEFSRKMRENLAAIEADIADLKSQATVATKDLQKDLGRKIDNLEEKRDEMKKRLDKFTSSSGRAWEKMKGGVERAWTEVKSAYNKAAVEFEDAEDRQGRGKKN
jgi:hypothetical protein